MRDYLTKFMVDCHLLFAKLEKITEMSNEKEIHNKIQTMKTITNV